MSTQVPEQDVKLPLQLQLPFVHALPAGHALVQLPQCAESLVRSTHVVPPHISHPEPESVPPASEPEVEAGSDRIQSRMQARSAAGRWLPPWGIGSPHGGESE